MATEHLDRLTDSHLSGPADLAVEIVSPDSLGRDRGDKFAEYGAAGIPEYWRFLRRCRAQRRVLGHGLGGTPPRGPTRHAPLLDRARPDRVAVVIGTMAGYTSRTTAQGSCLWKLARTAAGTSCSIRFKSTG